MNDIGLLPDLDLPPEVHEVCLLTQVELPVAVLELGDVVGALAQGHLEGHGESGPACVMVK